MRPPGGVGAGQRIQGGGVQRTAGWNGRGKTGPGRRSTAQRDTENKERPEKSGRGSRRGVGVGARASQRHSTTPPTGDGSFMKAFVLKELLETLICSFTFSGRQGTNFSTASYVAEESIPSPTVRACGRTTALFLRDEKRHLRRTVGALLPLLYYGGGCVLPGAFPCSIGLTSIGAAGLGPESPRPLPPLDDTLPATPERPCPSHGVSRCHGLRPRGPLRRLSPLSAPPSVGPGRVRGAAPAWLSLPVALGPCRHHASRWFVPRGICRSGHPRSRRFPAAHRGGTHPCCCCCCL